MRHASFASGIGGADLGFEQAGIESVFQCEADTFCLSILESHWPTVLKHSDLRILTPEEIPDADVWSCGFPCQDISVAGKRRGLEGPRSNLWFDFAQLVERKRPAWIVVENVPGLLSSNGGADMAFIVGQLSGFGYGVAWRVLDSQFFGVPQRRRRVYIIGHLGDLRAFEVLFEREGSGGDPPQSGGEVPSVADTLGTSADRISGQPGPIAYSLTGRGPGERLETEAAYVIGHGQGDPNFDRDRAFALDQGQPQQAVAYNIIGLAQEGRNHAYRAERTGAIQHKGNAASGNEAGTVIVSGPLEAADGHHGHSSPRGDGSDNLIVEALRVGGREQGAGNGPDNTPVIAFNWQSGGDNRIHPQEGRTDALQANQTIAIGAAADPDRMRAPPGIPRRLDSPRYRALGNAMTVNVMHWIGRRLQDSENLRK